MGDELYRVITGCLRLFDRRPDGRDTVLAELTPGAVFGEMALVTREVRSASVLAATGAEVLRLDYAALERIRRRFPYTGAKLFRNLAHVLADRLRRTTGALVGDEAPASGSEPRASRGGA